MALYPSGKDPVHCAVIIVFAPITLRRDFSKCDWVAIHVIISAGAIIRDTDVQKCPRHVQNLHLISVWEGACIANEHLIQRVI